MRLRASNYLLQFSLVLLLVSSLGCGKYGPPLAPEALSPAAVQDLQVTADLSGVTLSWEAPEKDLRGRELKFIDGYWIKRRKRGEDISEFEEIAEIPDTHLEVRTQLRQEAYRAGKLSRKVSEPEELRYFEFGDTSAVPGLTYFYIIVPFNNGDVEGQVRQTVRVQYRGDNSSAQVLLYGADDDAVGVDLAPPVDDNSGSGRISFR